MLASLPRFRKLTTKIYVMPEGRTQSKWIKWLTVLGFLDIYQGFLAPTAFGTIRMYVLLDV